MLALVCKGNVELLLWSDLYQEAILPDRIALFFPIPMTSKRSLDWQFSGMWPFCYSWIGYRQANGSPRVLLSYGVDHIFMCTHSIFVYDSNLLVIMAPFRCHQAYGILFGFRFSCYSFFSGTFSRCFVKDFGLEATLTVHSECTILDDAPDEGWTAG